MNMHPVFMLHVHRVLIVVSENEEQFANLWCLVYLKSDIMLIRHVGRTQEVVGG